MSKETEAYLLTFVRKKQNISAILYFEVGRFYFGHQMKYVRVITPERDTPKEKKSMILDFLSLFLRFILPKANPDLGHLHSQTHDSYVKYETNPLGMLS